MKYDLDEIKKMIKTDKVFFAIPPKSIKFVANHKQITETEAKNFIFKYSLMLESNNFFETRKQDLGIVADIYKTIIDSETWYIKFGIDEQDTEYLYYISFHLDI